MKVTGDKLKLRPKAQLVEWQVCADEREWQMAESQAIESRVRYEHTQQETHRWLLRWGTLSVLIVFVVVSLGAWWLWSIAQKGLEVVETDLEAAVMAELSSETPKHTASAEASSLVGTSLVGTMRLAGDASKIVTELAIRELGSDWAVIDMLIQPTEKGPSYRQTRVYRYSEQGWLRAKITAEHWGRSRQFESDYFVFHYHTVDKEAVAQAAARLDSLYLQLYSSFFADVPTTEKVAVVIDPEWTIGWAIHPIMLPKALTIPSPAATLRPADLPLGDLLLQSAMLALFAHLAEQATERYNLSSEQLGVYSGLRLWLIWEHELSLAVWREPLVKWVFRDPTVAVGPTGFVVPTFAHDLCSHHSLWMDAPVDISVPVLCWLQSDGEEVITAWRYYKLPVPLPLASLLIHKTLKSRT
jgi:hypothetical protein